MACAATPLEPKPPATDLVARKAVERVADRYRTLKGYRIEGKASTTVTTRNDRNETGRVVRFVVQRPGRLESEVREDQYTTRVVANGESLWTAVPELGQYTAQALAPLLAGSDSALIRGQLDPAADYAHLLSGIKRVQQLSRDTIRTARGVV